MGRKDRVKIPKTENKAKVLIRKPEKNGKIIWRFHRVDKGGRFAFDIEKLDHKLILDKLLAYSTMTWQEVEKATHDKGKSKNHVVNDAQENISKEAWQRLEAMHLEDEADSLFSFALNNLVRIWGLKLGDEFHVLWYDPRHEVFPTKNNR